MSAESAPDVLRALGASLAGPTAALAPTVALLALAVAATAGLRRAMDGVAARAGGTSRALFLALHGPGNVFHEVAHAAGFVVSGYRVARIRFFFNDDRGGGGYCQSGAPWAFWASAPLRALLAAPAPLILGSLLFAAVLWAMGLAPHGALVADALPEGWDAVVPHLADRGWALWGLAARVDPGDGRTWALVALAFLLGAHMLPSASDLAGIAFALVALLAMLWLAALVAGDGPAWARGPAAAVGDGVAWLLTRANALLAVGLACCGAALAASVPVALLAALGRR